ncbi:ATP-binding protein, partial [Actinomadura sp. KC345]|uniref:ATP-binding protein n=1 Tax=Actinomadura sp. KC345 TaxID=2530371 RepID=UPI00104DD04F
TGTQDTGTQDTGTQDTGTQDTGTQDTGTQDTGTTPPRAAEPARNGTGGGTSGASGSGGAAAAWVLVAEPRAAACARALTGRTLREWRVTDPGDIGDVVLMVDELVTNAVVHGTGPVRLSLRLDGRRLLAEVGDGNRSAPARPAEPRVLDWSEAGRGLLLVAALAAEHGARPEAEGKTVWFTRLLNPLGGHHRAAR